MIRVIGVLGLWMVLCSSGFGQTGRNVLLKDGWQIQSAVVDEASGAVISKPGHRTDDWLPAKVPTTVLAALVEAGEYENIFFGNHLENISSDRFDTPWWYRKTFDVENLSDKQHVRLRFNGINYRADVWLNGTQIVSADTLKGGFRRFEMDVTSLVRAQNNVLAVRVFHPEDGDVTLGFVDWNPNPPDFNMGIWREVELLVSGPVSIERPFVTSKVDTATLDQAELTVSALVKNHTSDPISGVLEGEIGENLRISQTIELTAGQAKKIIFTPGQFSQLNIDRPRLWWTHNLGEPNLYNLNLEFRVDKQVSDRKKVRFGIRSVSDYFTKEGHRGYRLNGKKIQIRGGGWTDPMLLNATPEYERAGIEYAAHMNLNTLRFEGFWGSNEHLYDLCDELGILVMVGWSAEWEWEGYIGTEADEFGGVKTPEQMDVAARSWEDQIIWLRNHPSIFLWMYGSDKLPRPALEQRYLKSLKLYDESRPFAGAAAEHNSIFTGPTGMKMRGPYDYVPPVYWYENKTNGGAFGFNTETGPGPQIPLRESLERMMPADSLWPISESWLYHAARNEFHNFNYYNRAMNRRLGEPSDLDDYLRKAQYLNYEGMRAMFEAFTANRGKATGIIQWMYNSSWPKLWWQLYDYYLLPNAAFYGARKANESLHIAYNYGRNGIDVMNNGSQEVEILKADIRLLKDDLSVAFQKMVDIKRLQERSTRRVLDLPEDPSITGTYFLDLKLRDKAGEVLSRNFYALSTQKDRLDEQGTTWFVTPQSQYADLSALQDLPEVKLEVEKEITQRNDTTFATVHLKNPTDKLAFMVRLNLQKRTSGESVVPMFWDDNYVTLLPGEEITVNGYCHTRNLDGEEAQVVVDGW